MNLLDERTIALAGVLQACQQVQQLARKGYADHMLFESSMQSVLVLDALNTPAVFGGINGVRQGLQILEQGVLTSPEMMNMEVLKYVMSVLQLQNQLYREQEKFAAFGQSVERLSSFSKEELIDACSDVYQTHISILRPQIIVQGEQEHLQQADVPAQVRTMLLAAFRAAVLWQQKDGNRFKLLWQRTRMQNSARALLSQATH